MYLWVARPGRRDVRGASPPGCSSTASSSRRGRSSARPARATSASRSCPSLDDCASAAAVEVLRGRELLMDRPETRSRRSSPRSTAASGAWPSRGRRRVGRRRPRRRRRSSSYFRLRKVEPIEVGPVRVPRQDPAEARLRRARRPRRAAGDGALRLVPLRGSRADAELRQHRRLGRPERTMVDTWATVGLVRADRRRRPPRRRGRHRRRARAAAGAAR